jgi:hypothetical protein
MCLTVHPLHYVLLRPLIRLLCLHYILRIPLSLLHVRHYPSFIAHSLLPDYFTYLWVFEESDFPVVKVETLREVLVVGLLEAGDVPEEGLVGVLHED